MREPLVKILLENAMYEREFCLAKVAQLKARLADLDLVIPQYRDRILREEMGVAHGRYEVER